MALQAHAKAVSNEELLASAKEQKQAGFGIRKAASSGVCTGTTLQSLRKGSEDHVGKTQN
jgi:hypothetical protein